MLRNYFLVTIRNIFRNRTLSLIHVAGFGLGIAAFLFAVQTVIFEYGFDKFHKDYHRIFNVATFYSDQTGSEASFLSSTPALYHRIKSQLPEAEYVTRYFDQSNREPYCVMTYTDGNNAQKSYNEINARYVDEDFLKVFDFKLLGGNRDNALAGVSSLVITRAIAEKYFGADNPIGKVLEISTGGPETRQTKFSYQVSGVLEDIPANSSLQFEILLPFRNFEENYDQDIKNIWSWPGFFTFIRTKNSEASTALTEKVDALIPKEELESWRRLGKSFRFEAQSLADFHFTTEANDSNEATIITNSEAYTLIIGLIGLSILFVAGVNYINLTTAKSLKRAREVGIRKVIGASRSQLVKQFLLDAFFINVVGFAFGLTLLQTGRPFIEIWSGRSFKVFELNGSQVVLCLIILLVSTILSGILPAFFLTKIEPARALKGLSLRSSGGGLLRKTLVVFQFAVSVGLMVFTSSILLQVEHMRSKDKGFEMDQRVIIKSVGTEDFDFSKFRSFKERIQGNTKIVNVTGAWWVPGLYNSGASEYSRTEFPTERVRLWHNVVDYDFAKTMGLTIKAGREFTKDRVTDEKVVMINESASVRLGYRSNEEAIGETITFFWAGEEGNMTLKIIGVVNDFNSNSPGIPIRPEIFMYANTAWPYGQYSYFIAHVAPVQLHETIGFLEQQWKETFPGAPFEYTFQDQAFKKVFEGDEKIQSIATLSTVLAIFIACMGLGGLVAFSVNQRIKEIGIRKTLGASVTRILIILSRDFIGLIFISMVITIPIVWFAVNEFLENYEYRINVNVWIFIVPCLLLLFIAIATMGYQTVRAANSNLVDALKHE